MCAIATFPQPCLVPPLTTPVTGLHRILQYGWGTDVVRRKERNARFAETGDRVVEVQKPLGVILEEDKTGDVFIAEVNPGSNGAKAGLKAGERISMVSATFGNELWSTQGAGLGRVTKAIKVRVGTSVKLVVQNDQEIKKAKVQATESADAKVTRARRQGHGGARKRLALVGCDVKPPPWLAREASCLTPPTLRPSGLSRRAKSATRCSQSSSRSARVPSAVALGCSRKTLASGARTRSEALA